MSDSSVQSKAASNLVDCYYRRELPEQLARELDKLQHLRDPTSTPEDQLVKNPLKLLISVKGFKLLGEPILNLQDHVEQEEVIFETFVRSIRTLPAKDASPLPASAKYRDLVYIELGGSYYYRLHFAPEYVRIERLMTIQHHFRF